MLNIIEYVVINQKGQIENEEISLLINDLTYDIIGGIYEIVDKVKILNIITKCPQKFAKLEKDIFEKNGIILNISNNYNKSLKKSNIIINYDFTEEEINKYVIDKNSCIINVLNKAKIYSKSFEGIIVNSCNIIDFKEKNEILKNEFDKLIVFESMIYKNTSYNNIREEILKSNLIIDYLIGVRGIIKKNEFQKNVKYSNKT